MGVAGTLDRVHTLSLRLTVDGVAAVAYLTPIGTVPRRNRLRVDVWTGRQAGEALEALLARAIAAIRACYRPSLWSPYSASDH